MSDNFLSFVERFDALLRDPAAGIDAPTAVSLAPAAVSTGAPVCVLVSPHPDDEAISGAIAWRLRHEAGWRVVNLAVTLGSRLDRRSLRWAEAQACCDALGFELRAASGQPGQGLEGISPKDAAANTPQWQQAVLALKTQLAACQPRLVVCPHQLDGHSTHIATSLLAQQAVAAWAPAQLDLLYSEYWNTQLEPRLAVGLSPQAVAALMRALVHHQGEIRRHPYHRLLPGWFADGARRGAERVNAPGSGALDFSFAALYGWRALRSGQWQQAAPMVWAPHQPWAQLF